MSLSGYYFREKEAKRKSHGNFALMALTKLTFRIDIVFQKVTKWSQESQVNKKYPFKCDILVYKPILV